MRKGLLYTFGALAVYLISLLVMLPAEPVLEWAEPRMQSRGMRLAASGLEGSIWSGEAGVVSINGVALGRASWDLQPLDALLGRVGVRWMLQPEGGYVSGNLSAAGEQLHLEDVEGRLPAARVMAFAPPLPVQIAGEFSTRIESLSVVNSALGEVNGTVVWHGATVTSPMQVPLGDLRVELSTAADGNVVGQVSDSGGPLELAGEVVLSPQGTYRMELNLATRPGASNELKQAMAMLGRPGPGGKRRLTYSGRLPI